ncbi:putative transcription repressor PLATZ family [Medicago truncatula]|uniref:PLATZ transcription factor family protein, putative n=1 Tax=Medicago truncatula TaxID=3880 RepID=A0A072TV38_MEDTR|nr:protein RGF1 INDUCIBLE TRANSCRIPTION FACTOR 1 [Medicago truncatula]KEH21041.1 PLATZ transcription factor family protein, putative [Medicago truncatula]RHN43319.1 putative transcription repressor PLATZ family [Medicago truncatula]
MVCCQYCISSGVHRHHKILKIYRHIYKDVVALSAMEKYFDCSEVQTYKSNRKVVISLKPRQFSEIASNAEDSCEVCNKKLNEPDLYRYCALSCKVEAVSKKSESEDPVSTTPLESSSGPSIQGPPQHQETQEGTSGPSLGKRKRKGIPHRSPFF